MKKILLILTTMLSLSAVALASEDGQWPRLEGEFLSNHNPKAKKAELEAEYQIIDEILKSNIDWSEVPNYNRADLQQFVSDCADGNVTSLVLKKAGVEQEKIEIIEKIIVVYKNKNNRIYNEQNYNESQN